MDLINQKTGIVVAHDVFFAESAADRAKGLIGLDEPKPMYFQTSFGIHTFGVKFPIDVVICNDQMEVVKIFRNVKPSRIIFWNPKFNNVLELPVGANVALGDKLELK